MYLFTCIKHLYNLLWNYLYNTLLNFIYWFLWNTSVIYCVSTCIIIIIINYFYPLLNEDNSFPITSMLLCLKLFYIHNKTLNFILHHLICLSRYIFPSYGIPSSKSGFGYVLSFCFINDGGENTWIVNFFL